MIDDAVGPTEEGWFMLSALMCVLCLGYLAAKILEWYDGDREEKLMKRDSAPSIELRRSERIMGRKMGKAPWR